MADKITIEIYYRTSPTAEHTWPELSMVRDAAEKVVEDDLGEIIEFASVSHSRGANKEWIVRGERI